MSFINLNRISSYVYSNPNSKNSMMSHPMQPGSVSCSAIGLNSLRTSFHNWFQ
jgi:hypothetical protein